MTWVPNQPDEDLPNVSYGRNNSRGHSADYWEEHRQLHVDMANSPMSHPKDVPHHMRLAAEARSNRDAARNGS